MMLKKALRSCLIITLVIINIGCDQATKSIVRNTVSYDERISIWSHYVTITKIENTGAFLSLGQSWPSLVKLFLLNGLPLAVLIFSLVFVFRNINISKLTVMGICFVIGGGIGNIFDRMLYGSVTDFLHIDFIIFQTGIFNLADVSIMMGLAIVLLESYRRQGQISKG